MIFFNAEAVHTQSKKMKATNIALIIVMLGIVFLLTCLAPGWTKLDVVGHILMFLLLGYSIILFWATFTKKGWKKFFGERKTFDWDHAQFTASHIFLFVLLIILWYPGLKFLYASRIVYGIVGVLFFAFIVVKMIKEWWEKNRDNFEIF